jgi:anti-sigma regulatory factor (Ser/Thr protein kinase)
MCTTTERAELLLPGTETAPRAAREFARASGCSDHIGPVLDDALLLISELVTNSVRHGSLPITIALECDDGGLKVLVRDGTPALPQQRTAGAGEETGRGLTLVAALSDAWGVEAVEDELGTGKAVWFELRPPR